MEQLLFTIVVVIATVICLGCALVFGVKVFKLTGNVPRT